MRDRKDIRLTCRIKLTLVSCINFDNFLLIIGPVKLRPKNRIAGIAILSSNENIKFVVIFFFSPKEI